MLHPVNRLSTHCITSITTLLLSYRSCQDITNSLYTEVLVTDQLLVAETSTYRITLGAANSLTPIVVTLTPSPKGILYLILPVHFMQEPTSLLLLTLKYSTRQPLQPNKQNNVVLLI